MKLPASMLADVLGLQELVAVCSVGNGVPGTFWGTCYLQCVTTREHPDTCVLEIILFQCQKRSCTWFNSLT